MARLRLVCRGKGIRRQPKTNVWEKLLDPIDQLFGAMSGDREGEERCPACKGRGIIGEPNEPA